MMESAFTSFWRFFQWAPDPDSTASLFLCRNVFSMSNIHVAFAFHFRDFFLIDSQTRKKNRDWKRYPICPPPNSGAGRKILIFSKRWGFLNTDFIFDELACWVLLHSWALDNQIYSMFISCRTFLYLHVIYISFPISFSDLPILQLSVILSCELNTKVVLMLKTGVLW